MNQSVEWMGKPIKMTATYDEQHGHHDPKWRLLTKVNVSPKYQITVSVDLMVVILVPNPPMVRRCVL